MFKSLIFVCLLCLSLNAASEKEMKQQIGSLLLVGFPDEEVNENSQIIKDIKEYNLRGVILFDRFYSDRSKVKNIRDSKQLKILTSKLQKASKQKLLIAIDQEGGKVARLKEKYGFEITPSAKEVANLSHNEAKQIYDKLAKMLQYHGINFNLAPVVDLSVNPENFVISGLNRSYGENSQKVTSYAKDFISSLKEHNILSSLKHFPGHGSSLGDSHNGFVDISDTWSQKELEPYINLISSKHAKMIMTAHVFNKNLDEKYPATLSKKINTALLREKLGFKGVIISDDLQMGAIRKEFSLNETLRLAINAGVDILIFANQLDNYKTKTIIDTIYKEIQKGNISYELIKKANERIDSLIYKTFHR